MHDAAAALRKSARLLDEAAHWTEASAAGARRRRTRYGGPPVDCNAIND